MTSERTQGQAGSVLSLNALTIGLRGRAVLAPGEVSCGVLAGASTVGRKQPAKIDDASIDDAATRSSAWRIVVMTTPEMS
jgi:hypothetical protein